MAAEQAQRSPAFYRRLGHLDGRAPVQHVPNVPLYVHGRASHRGESSGTTLRRIADVSYSTHPSTGGKAPAANRGAAPSITSAFAVGAPPARWSCFAGKSRKHLAREGWMYEAPKLERLGTLRELTLAGGDFTPGDGANAFHRYAPLPG